MINFSRLINRVITIEINGIEETFVAYDGSVIAIGDEVHIMSEASGNILYQFEPSEVGTVGDRPAYTTASQLALQIFALSKDENNCYTKDEVDAGFVFRNEFQELMSLLNISQLDKPSLTLINVTAGSVELLIGSVPNGSVYVLKRNNTVIHSGNPGVYVDSGLNPNENYNYYLSVTTPGYIGSRTDTVKTKTETDNVTPAKMLLKPSTSLTSTTKLYGA